MKRHIATSAFLVALLPALAIPAAASPAADHKPRSHTQSLDILLTNDDGYDARTLAAMKHALSAAGHRVTVSAPCTDQSGKGTSQASNYARGNPTEENTIVARQEADDTWAVCGTPSDAVLFGVQHAFSEPPDLVVSGVNPGHNTGAVANHSGTVSATVMAGELDIRGSRSAWNWTSPRRRPASARCPKPLSTPCGSSTGCRAPRRPNCCAAR